MNIKKFTFNPVSVNAFVVWDETLDCVIIDAACFYPEEQQQLQSFIENNHLHPVKLLNTHGHFDHLMGNGFVNQVWGLKCEIHQEDNYLIEQAKSQSLMFGIPMPQPPMASKFLTDGEVVCFGNSSLEVIFVPGHSPGGIAFYSEKEQFLIAGDILFYGSVGRTDLPGGNHEQLISGILNRLMTLPEAVRVYCGHGPETTIGNEKKSNPYLRL